MVARVVTGDIIKASSEVLVHVHMDRMRGTNFTVWSINGQRVSAENDFDVAQIQLFLNRCKGRWHLALTGTVAGNVWIRILTSDGEIGDMPIGCVDRVLSST